MSSASNPITVIIRSAPSADLEAAELALALGAFDIPVRVVFSDAGLFWLLKQEPRKPHGKAPLKVLSAFPMYGIDTLYYYAEDLARCGINESQLPPQAKGLSRTELQEFMFSSSQCLTF